MGQKQQQQQVLTRHKIQQSINTHIWPTAQIHTNSLHFVCFPAFCLQGQPVHNRFCCIQKTHGTVLSLLQSVTQSELCVFRLHAPLN